MLEEVAEEQQQMVFLHLELMAVLAEQDHLFYHLLTEAEVVVVEITLVAEVLRVALVEQQVAVLADFVLMPMLQPLIQEAAAEAADLK
jgi:hypothetical protein